VKLLKNRSPVARHLFLILLEKSLENFLEELSERSNVFIISKRQFSLSNKFYDRNQTLQAEAVSIIVRIDWPHWLALYQFFIVINYICDYKRNCGIYMFHLIARASSGIQVLPVADSFSNQEMRTFSRIRAHQSTNETLKTSLWRRETKPSSLNYFAVVVLATNKTCSASPWRVSVFSLL